MSSHREAPEISKDPVADSTDLYAFVSPDRPESVTIIANYIPLEEPAGGPNFYEFGDDVIYQIKIDNDGDGHVDVTYDFVFTTTVANPKTFLYNTGPIDALDSPNWNRKQTYKVVRTDARKNKAQTLGNGLTCPPCNIGPRSTPNYAALADAAVHDLPGGRKVFAGQRAEGFYVDLGAIFDLGILRPFQQLHTTFGLQNTGLGAMAAGVNSTKGVNVHSIAIEVPKTDVSKGGAAPTDASRRCCAARPVSRCAPPGVSTRLHAARRSPRRPAEQALRAMWLRVRARRCGSPTHAMHSPRHATVPPDAPVSATRSVPARRRPAAMRRRAES